MSGIARLDYDAMKRQFATGDSFKPSVNVNDKSSEDAQIEDNKNTGTSDSSQSDEAHATDTSDNSDDKEAVEEKPAIEKSETTSNAKQDIEQDIDPSEEFKQSFNQNNVSKGVSVADFDDVDPSENDVDSEDKKPDRLEEVSQEVRNPVSRDEYIKRAEQQNKQRQGNKPLKSVAKIADNQENFAVIKRFPKNLLQVAQDMFSGAENQTQALAAYIYYKEGCPDWLDVSDDIKDLVKRSNNTQLTAEDLRNSFEDNLASVDARLRKLISIVNAIELGLAYSICDNAGFSKIDQSTPGDFDFLELSVTDLLKRLNDQSELRQRRIVTNEGQAFNKISNK